MKYLEYVEKRLKAMYMGAYSNEYSEKAKSLPHYFGRVLTAEEHSKMSEMDFDVYFQNEQALFKWYFSYPPVYNFINDSHFAGQGISGFSQEQMILLCFRPFSRKWQKIPPAEFSR